MATTWTKETSKGTLVVEIDEFGVKAMLAGAYIGRSLGELAKPQGTVTHYVGGNNGKAAGLTTTEAAEIESLVKTAKPKDPDGKIVGGGKFYEILCNGERHTHFNVYADKRKPLGRCTCNDPAPIPEENPPCAKCGSYCYGDCEAN